MASRMASAAKATVLITGANRGLGFELAQLLLRTGGYHVIAAARCWPAAAVLGATAASPANAAHSASGTATLGGVASTAAAVLTEAAQPHGACVDFVQLDVASPESRRQAVVAVGELLTRGGGGGGGRRLYCLVNNAGIYVERYTAADFAAALDTNTIGPLRLAQALRPLFAPGGDAQVVNVSTGLSRLALLPAAYRAAVQACASVDDLERGLRYRPDDAEAKAGSFAPYKVSKAALNRGTQLLAAEWAGDVRVNSVDPGWCRTDM
jgi:NAD(P)-dependent dehydrogenase (short-subunit alcohol dehydrogenase family)